MTLREEVETRRALAYGADALAPVVRATVQLEAIETWTQYTLLDPDVFREWLRAKCLSEIEG